MNCEHEQIWQASCVKSTTGCRTKRNQPTTHASARLCGIDQLLQGTNAERPQCATQSYLDGIQTVPPKSSQYRYLWASLVEHSSSEHQREGEINAFTVAAAAYTRYIHPVERKRKYLRNGQILYTYKGEKRVRSSRPLRTTSTRLVSLAMLWTKEGRPR